MRKNHLPAGKLETSFLQELLAAAAPGSPDVLLGPAIGEDAAAVAVTAGTLIVATDPITFTGRGLGRYAVVINANDVAVSGVRPRWFLCTLLLPPRTDEAQIRGLFREIRDELRTLGASLIGGHTEVTPAVNQPIAVGQFIGHSPSGRFLRTGSASAGDWIVQVNPAPVEGAAVLAAACPRELEGLPERTLEQAAKAAQSPGISIVEPALRAAELGATSLHDPTEGGLATALWEVADASDLALEVDESAVLWFEPGLAVCRRLGANPWGTLASGTLLAAFPEERSADAVAALRKDRYETAVIGRATRGSGVHNTAGEPLPRFEPDEVARTIAPR